jgi:hypothetical protein
MLRTYPQSIGCCFVITGLDSRILLPFQSGLAGAGMRATLLLLLFILLGVEKGQADVAVYAQYDGRFAEYDKACFSNPASVSEADRNILMCDQALSNPRLFTLDREMLIERRAELERIKQSLLEQQRRTQELPHPGSVAPKLEVTETPPSGDGGWGDGSWVLAFLGPVFRFVQVNTIFGWTAGVVVTGLFIWLLVSIASSTPAAILKQRAVIVGWVAIPALIAGALFYWGHLSNGELYVSSFLVTWTAVFSALTVGGVIREYVTVCRVPPSSRTARSNHLRVRSMPRGFSMNHQAGFV